MQKQGIKPEGRKNGNGISRREFVFGVGAFAGSALLSSCVPMAPAGGNLLAEFGNGLAMGASPFATGKRLATARDDQDSAVAERIFRSAFPEARKIAPSVGKHCMVPPRKIVERAQRGVRAAEKALESINPHRINWTSASDVERVARVAIPVIGEADRVFAAKERQDDRGITLNPGEAIEAEFQGFCLDKRLPAPGRKPLRLIPGKDDFLRAIEPLRLFPASRYYPGGQGRYLSSIGRFAAHISPDRFSSSRADCQGLIWAIQAALARDGEIALNEEQWRILRAADPKAAQAIRARMFAQQLGKRFLKDVVNIGGRSLRLDTSNKRSVQDLMEALMGGGAASVASPGTRTGASPYTLLAPGVAAYAEAAPHLLGTARIVNASTTPFVFDPFSYMAEAASATQRVLIGPWSASPGILDRLIDLYTGYLDRFTDWLGRSMAGLEGEIFWGGRIRNSPYFKSISEIFTKPLVSTPMKLMVDSIPVLGNFLAAVEVATGYEWTAFLDSPENREKHRLDSAGLVLAAMGTIPGAGAVARAAGTSARMSRVVTGALRAKEFIGSADDVMEIGSWIKDEVFPVVATSKAGLPTENRIVAATREV